MGTCAIIGLLMNADELKYWIAFNRIPGIGRVRLALLESRFGSLGRAWQAGASELTDAGLDARSARAVALSLIHI